MVKKNDHSQSGIIYSTDPTFELQNDKAEVITLPPQQQKLKITLDKKHRAGKEVTLISGFVGSLPDLETLARQLKTFCGTGGSVKEGAIIIQGDTRQKVISWLSKNGYKV